MNVRESMRAVLQAEADAITRVAVTHAYEQAVEQIATCVGKVVTTGMGKAGLMARKFAATLSSTGTPAVFLHPGEAAHGDLGMVTADDVIVAFSTSGQTTEVIECLRAAKRLGVSVVIGITAHPQSPLRVECSYVLDMGIVTEPCVLGLTPSASSAVMLAIGDALALTVMQMKGITREDFGVRHRAGYLGQQACSTR